MGGRFSTVPVAVTLAEGGWLCQGEGAIAATFALYSLSVAY
ncbi:MAG: hypothetical protein R2864_11930 [Syntrophotaleaceae bacterium]